MQIKILGNGGAINDGLPFNSFMVDEFFLAETPPDIMNSLFREKVNLTEIRNIYLSHYHGDHYFGLPFLILRLFFNAAGKTMDYKITLIGPADVRSRTEEICRLALGVDHPVNDWIDNNFLFTQISSGSEINLDDKSIIKIFPMSHMIETYGFSFYKNDRIVFSYFADTLWSDELLSQIQLFPELIIADLNGEPSDPRKVHMSEADIIEKAIPHSEGKIRFYGTHLKSQKESSHKNIQFVYPGEVIRCSA